jgi:hypothetical protein
MIRVTNLPPPESDATTLLAGPLVNRGTFHTKELYRLSDDSLGGGCTSQIQL